MRSLALYVTVLLLISSWVTGHSGLRATGYFHLIASFSVFNIVYFVIKLLYLALTTLTSDFINLEFLADWLNENDWLKRFFSDLVIAIVGLQILLLSVMTIEHRFNLSRWFSVGICEYKLGYKSHDLL